MKDLGIYFSPVTSEQSYRKNQLGSLIIKNDAAGFPEMEERSVALFAIAESRNSNLNTESSDFDSYRHSLYQLYKGNWNLNVYDLGTILPGETIEDTYSAVRDVVEELVKNNITPLVIGGSQDLMLPVYQAYEKLEQTVNILDVDCRFDMGSPENSINSEAWLNKIVLHKPSYLFNYTLFGYQSYFVDIEEMKLLEKMLFDKIRLGEFLGDDKIVEPLLRNTDIVSFDLDAIRASDYKSNSRSLPHGLYGEDACKVMRYAGISDKLTTIGIFNYNNKNNTEPVDANLLAQMTWYFFEGFDQRKGDFPIGSKANYTKYTVTIDDFKDEIVFYKSDKSSRWWMEVPYPRTPGTKMSRHLMIPCNYSDYENALQNEMPQLWWKTFEKLA